VARRLVITNGDWTTRHEIGEATIVIGRDPNCDLFFVNQKLSRRHARVEPGPDGVKLVDLGSRNGIWVNEKKIEERLLAPGDSIRLGGLRIVYEEDEAERTPAVGPMDSTVMLPGGPVTETFWKETPLADSEDAEATVLLPAPPANVDRTVVLAAVTPGESATRTVILGGESDATSKNLEGEFTRALLAGDATESPGRGEPLVVLEPETLGTRVKDSAVRLGEWGRRALARTGGRLAGSPWQTKFVVILSGLGFLLGVFLAWLASFGSTVSLAFIGLALAVMWAQGAHLLARKLVVKPVASLRRDVEAVRNGEKRLVPARREYRELEQLAESINRLTGDDPSSESTTLPGDSTRGL